MTFRALWRDVRSVLRGLFQKRSRQGGVRDESSLLPSPFLLGSQSYPSITGCTVST